jgi:predicted nucleic acid-binding protein
VTVFVDSSALYAQLDPDDEYHDSAVEAFPRLARSERLVTHNYAFVESVSLVQARLGIDAAAALVHDIARLLELIWVDEMIHSAALTALLAARSRQTSFVDWTSFEVMRRENIEVAFAFDRDFVRQGFRLVP